MERSHSTLMHEVNERLHTVFANRGSEDGDFICECDRIECFETIKITLREYAARSEAQPILAPGHETKLSSVSPIVS
jgi:hypothetical protein